MPGFDLSKWEDDYKTAPAEREGQGGGSVPDGKYQVRVARVELTESKLKHSPMLAWELDIISGPQRGRKLWRNNVLVSAENIRYLKLDLGTCGLVLKQLNDLNNESTLEKLIGVTLEVTQKTKGENRNVYFDKRILVAKPQGQAPETPAPAWSNDDVPF